MEEWVCESDGDPLPYREECYQLLGACFAVYKDKGCGFLEAAYQECPEIELHARDIPCMPQPELALTYRGRTLRQKYMPDFICYDRIIIEIKAQTNLGPEHRAQTMNYLWAAGMELGLLVNFGHYPRLEYERIAHTMGRYSRP